MFFERMNVDNNSIVQSHKTVRSATGLALPLVMEPYIDTLAATPKGSSLHLDYLDGLRALSALYVLIHHAVLQVNITATDSAIVKWLAFLFAHGRYAVDLFIVISGYCLMLPIVRNDGILRNGAAVFFKRRIIRIVPTYYAAMALSMLLIYTVIGEKTGTNWDISIPINTWDVVTHLLLIQDLFHNTIFKINHAFWSISVEFHIYFLFPLFVIVWKKWGVIFVITGVVILSLLIWFFLAKIGLNVYGASPHYIVLFTLGMTANYIVYKRVALWKLGIISIILLVAILVHPIIGTDILAGIGSACLLVSVASGKLKAFCQLLSCKPMVSIGSFAYSIYLVHAPLLQIISKFILLPFAYSPVESMLFFLFIGVPIIIIISYVFYLCAEKPFIITRRAVNK